ncbi:MAG TPA: TonB-dependent receptor [Acidobacteriaceae bacterium]|nr:TonB-dependent receptor [Acidobacteriaceae bacterium]
MLGQAPTNGAIGGRVVSATGAPLHNALIIAVDPDSGVEVQGQSGPHGEFLLPRLPVGDYVLRVGNVTAREELVHVALGDVTEVELRVGGKGEALSLQTASGPASNVADSELEELPISNGEWRGAELTAVRADGAAQGDEDQGAVSFRGVDLAQNSTRLDGVSSDDGFSGRGMGTGVAEDSDSEDGGSDPAAGAGGGARSVAGGGQRAGPSYAFSGAAVREFRVQGQGSAAQYGSALYGHEAGGAVMTVSRSGSSELHGMVFYSARDSAWAATDPFALAQSFANGLATAELVRPADLLQQFGGRIGGPLWQSGGRSASVDWNEPRGIEASSSIWRHRGVPDRMFYFYAFDAQRRSFPAVSSPGYPGFYSLTGMQEALLGNRGVSAAKTRMALGYLASLTGRVPRRQDQETNFGRLDWQHGSASHMAVEYDRLRWRGPGAARTGAVVNRALASFGSSYGSIDAGLARWEMTLRPALSNEVWVQSGRELKYEAPQPPLAQEPGVGPGGLPPEVSIGPEGFVFGTPAALGRRAYPEERRTEFADVVAWAKGRHLVQAGVDVSWLSDMTDSLSNEEGTFSYDSGTTGGKAGGLVDWITDYTFGVNAYPNGACPSIYAAPHYFCFRSFSQSFGEESLSWKTRQAAAFMQDDWRVSPRLTLHLGLRYEMQRLPLPQRPNVALDAAFGSLGATSIFPEDHNNFGPRVGLAWSPFGLGRGVLRAGFGMYYGKLPGATVRAALLNTALPQSTTRIRITPKTETPCPQMPSVGFGYPCAFLEQPQGTVAATTSAMVFDRRFRLPAVEQGTVEFERAVPGGVSLRAAYAMNLDRQLPNSVDINIAPASSMAGFRLQGGTGAVGVRDGEVFYVPIYTSRRSADFGPVTDIISNANATYHGLTLEARRGVGSTRTAAGMRRLDFRVSWTWSKAIDFGQNGGSVPRTNGQFDPVQVRYDKGLSALNFPHRVSATVLWSPRVEAATEHGGALPVAERTAWRLADGWSVAAIFYEASGRGYSYNIFGGARLNGGRESINGSGGSVVLPTVGRNTLRLPDRINLDMRLSRNFRVWRDGVWLRVEAEAFNVANHLNYAGVEQRAFLVGDLIGGLTPLTFQDQTTVAAEGLNTPPFGAFTSAVTSQSQQRHIQMGLRLEF